MIFPAGRGGRLEAFAFTMLSCCFKIASDDVLGHDGGDGGDYELDESTLLPYIEVWVTTSWCLKNCSPQRAADAALGPHPSKIRWVQWRRRRNETLKETSLLFSFLGL